MPADTQPLRRGQDGAMVTPALTDDTAGTLDIGGDLHVRRLGYGAMRITGAGIWGDPPDRDGAKALLRRVVELGIDLIDTADSYGPEVSEDLIAEALHPYPEGLVIATKGGLLRTGPGQWPPDGRPEHLREACEASLRRLRLDVITSTSSTAPTQRSPTRTRWGRWPSCRPRARCATSG
ncbi:hypothetical protein BH18ACT1_BH18ACT1_08400 [soil metagenome]